MVIADTSVWIDYINGVSNQETTMLTLLNEHQEIVMIDLIFLEILQGLKSDRTYNMVKNELKKLPIYSCLNQDLVFYASMNYRYLRKKGVTVRKTIDNIIATFCIEHNLPLLYRDRDFLAYEKHLNLKNALNLY